MSDFVPITPGSGANIAVDDIAGLKFQRFKVTFGPDGTAVDVSAADPLPVSLAGTVPVSGPLTDAQLRAAAVPVSGPLTDAQLRATSVPVSGPATDAQLRATPLAVSGPLTDTQLRAAAVPVSDGGGALTVDGTVGVSGTVAVSAVSLPLPTGAATETTLAALNAKVPAAGQALMAASQPVVIASNQTAVPTVENATVITGAAAQTATVNNILDAVAGAAGTDVTNQRSATVQVVSTGTAGTFIFEQSNDNVNWVALPVFNAALVTGVPITAAITATASQIIYTFPIRCRFIRLRIATLITGGSLQAFSRLSGDAWTPAVFTVANPTAANLQTTVNGGVSLVAGANLAADVGLQVRANATGAATGHHIVSAASTNVAQIKATAGRVVGYSLSNNNAAWRYVKLHNVASATAGTGVVQTIGIPPNGKSECSIPAGIAFATAISRSIVTGAADADATAVGLNDVVGDIFFA
jgi:hypothetical protein